MLRILDIAIFFVFTFQGFINICVNLTCHVGEVELALEELCGTRNAYVVKEKLEEVKSFI